MTTTTNAAITIACAAAAAAAAAAVAAAAAAAAATNADILTEATTPNSTIAAVVVIVPISAIHAIAAADHVADLPAAPSTSAGWSRCPELCSHHEHLVVRLHHLLHCLYLLDHRAPPSLAVGPSVAGGTTT